MGICLLHFVEHFDMGGRPPFPPEWLKSWDFWSNEIAFFLFAGKSYSLFALLFGLSFYIQMDNAERKGSDFRLKFLWRLGLLYAIGYLHSLLFVGDFLTVIACFGVPLVFLWKVPGRWLWVLCGAFMLIIPHAIQVARIFLESGFSPAPFSPGRFYRDVGPAMLQGDLADVFRVNVWLGHKAKWNWTIENGRYLQMLGLFILGLLLGRSGLLKQPEKLVRVARWILIIGLCVLVPLYLLKQGLPGAGLSRNSLRYVGNFLSMHINGTQMLAGSALLVLLFQTGVGRSVIGLLIPYGRMSLSCYVSQALIGAPLFYHFGLGMYRHMGPFFSLSAGVVFFSLHLALAHLWLRHFHQGPLEWLWRCATELDFSRPFRRRSRAVETEPRLAEPAAQTP